MSLRKLRLGRRVGAVAALVALLFGAPSLGLAGLAESCESGKLKAAGKHAYCRQKAEASFSVIGDALRRSAQLATCDAKLAKTWASLEARAVLQGGMCPTDGDGTTIRQKVDDHTTNIATALATGVLLDCNPDLAGCQRDLAICQQAPAGQLRRTGQTTCWDHFGSAVPCAGTGHDGESQKGLARSFTVNANGTITDNRTGLVWEKLSDDGGIHDFNNGYSWSNAIASKVASLNATSFAGFNDWRLPNIRELLSILDLGSSAGVPSVFSSNCTPGCTVTTCSCTLQNFYWSSTPRLDIPDQAWTVHRDGFAPSSFKSDIAVVRAVRGG